MLGRTISDWIARASRRKVSLPAAIFREDGTSVLGQITDLSYDGCHLLSEADFYVGESFTLALPGRGRVPAQVRWRDDIKYGLRLIVETSGKDARRARIGV